MKYGISLIGSIVFVLVSENAFSGEFSYDNVKKRYPKSALSGEELDNAKMQGECLVGLKDINFKKRDKFDPISEWSNYRALSLLEQFPPCEVLVMMEVAQSKLRSRDQ